MPDETQKPGADAGDPDIIINSKHRVTSEQLEEYLKFLKSEGFSKSQREELLRKYSEYDKELEDKSYEELLDDYKELYKDTAEYKIDPDSGEEHFNKLAQKKTVKSNLDPKEIIDTPEELRAEVRELMRSRDSFRVYEQNQKYDEELKGKSYEQLADEYKVRYALANPDEFPNKGDFERFERTNLKRDKDLDTLKELKAEVRDLLRQRDFGLELDDRYDKDMKELGLDAYEDYENVAERYKDFYKKVHKGTPEENKYEGKDLKDFEHLDNPRELEHELKRLWWEHDEKHPVTVTTENVKVLKNDTDDPVEGQPLGLQRHKIVETPPDSDEQAGADAAAGDAAENQTSWEPWRMPWRWAPEWFDQAAAGDDEIDIELLERLEKYNKTLEDHGLSKSQRGELLRKYSEYDEELEGKSYEELLSIYKEVYKDAGGYRPDIAEEVFNLLEQKSARSALNQWEIIDTPEELRAEVRELMATRDLDRVLKQEIETPPDSGEQAGAEVSGIETRPWEQGFWDQFRQGGLPDEKDEQEKEAPPVDKAEPDASIVKPPWRWGTNEEEAPVDKPDVSSATEQRVEPPGSEPAPIVGDASRLIGGEALPTDDALRDKALSGEEEEGAPDVAAPAPAEATAADAAAPAEAAAEGAEIEMSPDSVEQAGADAAAEGEAAAAIGAEAVGEAGGDIGETIEEVAASEAVLVDPPADTGAPADVVEPMEDPAANAAYEGVETPPSLMEDTFEGGDLGNVGEEDVVEHIDDPVVDP